MPSGPMTPETALPAMLPIYEAGQCPVGNAAAVGQRLGVSGQVPFVDVLRSGFEIVGGGLFCCFCLNFRAGRRGSGSCSVAAKVGDGFPGQVADVREEYRHGEAGGFQEPSRNRWAATWLWSGSRETASPSAAPTTRSRLAFLMTAPRTKVSGIVSWSAALLSSYQVHRRASSSTAPVGLAVRAK